MRQNRTGLGVVVEMPTGPHLMLDPLTLDPVQVREQTVPVLTPESAASSRWALGGFVPPIEAQMQGLEERRPRGYYGPLEGRVPIASKGAEVQILYPNGELHATRHKDTGARLKVGGDQTLTLAADQAERLGLADWMPFTRPKATQTVVPPPGSVPRSKGQAVGQVGGTIGRLMGPGIIDALLNSRERELFAERVANPDSARRFRRPANRR
jgi:hypothetical protein